MRPTRSVIALAAAVAVPIAIQALWPRPTHDFLGAVAAPAPVASRTVDWLRRVTGSRSAAERRTYEELEADVNRLTVEVARLKKIQAENEELRALLNFSESSTQELILARVIGRSVDPERNVIVIDRGEEQGIVSGLAAVSGDGLVVGLVTEAGSRRSTITLLTDEQSRIPVQIEGSESVRGVLEGGHGTGTRMRLIPATASVSEGDVVVTSDLDASVPRGLVVGTVEAVRDEEHIPFQVAVVRPSADIESATTVAVVRTGE